jgi:vacuolar-type H+-ATPase subunit I/STV1
MLPILAETTITFPPLTISEVGGLFGMAAMAAALAGWLLNLILASKYVKTGQCAVLHVAGDSTMRGALDRIEVMEKASDHHHSHIEQIEEHLRSVDKLASAQAKLEKDMALSQQPITEFKSWMDDIRVLLGKFVEKTEERGLDHETRLVRVEERMKLAGSKERG